MGSSPEAKSILAPLILEMKESLEEGNIDKIAAFYDPDAVFIEIGKSGVWGKEIKPKLMEWDQRLGKTTYKPTEEKYEMAGDYIIITMNVDVKSEKMGDIKMKITQIWRKSNNTYLIMHDEFAVL
ncbi:hypothetical protein NECAME_09440 [Necator americanus]|uniref:DUF4440 domain-containing protein n=1 Tax=Necator americanus TaxID=51031 RepID=W2TE01_NECAM|nr:hypothetical protein NECAME_09440 [Necator americanus]ETN80073.1 hypothetical protein NECAME_09440 [Necator americanus]